MNFLKNVTKDVVLNQTTYGAIKSARWGAQDRNVLEQYSSGTALGVENHFLALGRRYPPAGQNESCQKGAKPKPATEMARGDTQGGVGTAGAMGSSLEPALPLGNPLTHNQDKKSSLM